MSTFSIQVKNSFEAGNTMSIDVTNSTTVMDIQKKIKDYWDIKPDEQALVYASTRLEDSSKTVKELNMVENSTLYLVAKLRGGLI